MTHRRTRLRAAALAASLLCLAAPAALAQPSPIAPSPAAPARALAGEWTATRIGGVERLPASAPRLRFDGREVVGGDGCNHIAGRLGRAGAGRIEFGPLVSTKMACEPDAMTAAMAFHRALKAARSYRIEGATMQIADARGEVVLVLERAK